MLSRVEARPRRQCAKCPWKVGVDPTDIPGEYSVDRHRALADTIAEEGRVSADGLKIMACHETPPGAEKPCVGWLVHQVGVGNNLGLRMATIAGRVDTNVETVGPQHPRFEDTLPRKRTRFGNEKRIVWIEYDGVRDTLSATARRHGLAPEVLAGRLRIGWTIERALTSPVRPQRRKEKR